MKFRYRIIFGYSNSSTRIVTSYKLLNNTKLELKQYYNCMYCKLAGTILRKVYQVYLGKTCQSYKECVYWSSNVCYCPVY